jgi:hypothetical protein
VALVGMTIKPAIRKPAAMRRMRIPLCYCSG